MDLARQTQLDEEGYCIVPGVVPPGLLARLREETARILGGLPKGHEDDNRSTGSMVTVYESPVFADLIALPEAREALRSTGFHDAKFSSGYIISKPPKSPRLFWHYDWAGWDAPESFTVRPTPQLFFMYYLTDTRRENGCLRVVPRSHIEDNDLIPLLDEAHTPELLRAADPSRPAFSDRPDEVDVPVTAGDLLIGDARLLHASHANQSDERRTVITLWFHPDPDTFGERLQAFCANMVAKTPADWPDEARAKLEAMVCRYAGSAEPWPWNRHRPFPARVGA
ncbi:MAG: phytanoyl-CoA dioxygenase family protein [Candidatus Hydrogenedentes bacterium]|nr:phytanoyl-CoA dioxygenase family protein [Candidatus Hydrogenedentota bacterium]